MNATGTFPPSPSGSDQLLNRAEQLIWKLLDDDLPESGVVELEAMFREHPSVYVAYINCIQLHVDLTGHFGKLQVAQGTESLVP